MPEPRDIDSEGQALEPQPDPWGPPGANALQAGSIAAGVGAAGALGGDSSSTETINGALGMLPDPTQVFAHVANILGFQLDGSNARTWAFVLIVLCVALNIISLGMRYRYARHIEQEQARNLAKQEQLRTSAAASPRGFISG
jgi:hypothetical protein